MKDRRPESWKCIRTIDAHTAGEPLRVIVEGYPELRGATMLDLREEARSKHDGLRRALMLEPRGHADMYGCLLTPAPTSDGDVGVLFLHNEGYSTMCGHGIIGLVKIGVDCGLLELPSDGVLRIDTPAGRVRATAQLSDGRVARVAFDNVPSFVLRRDLSIEVPGIGQLCCDIAFGGAFYAYVDATRLGLTLEPEKQSELIDLGRRIKHAVSDQFSIVHPTGDAGLNFLYGTIFHRPGRGEVHSRNVCIFADGEVDRSPTGTGVSGRAALLYAAGDLPLGRTIAIESILGTRFDVTVTATSTVGELAAVIPRVGGSAWITGKHEFLIDPDDPLGEGFLLR